MGRDAWTSLYSILYLVHTFSREGTSPRPPLADFDGGASSFGGATNLRGCRVGREGRGSASAGGLWAVGRAGAPRAVLKPNTYEDIQCNVITTTWYHVVSVLIKFGIKDHACMRTILYTGPTGLWLVDVVRVEQ